MKSSIPKSVIDSCRPWKLSRPSFAFPDYTQKLPRKEWKALLARAEKGDPEAEFGVGATFDYGCRDGAGRILVRKSHRKAVEWYRRAAQHGSDSAQNNLGVLLGNGQGAKKNPREAILWLRRAIRQDNSCAKVNMAITYRELGEFRRAVEWFKRSAQGGDGGALIQLGIHYYWGKGTRRDYGRALRCFRRAMRSISISEADRDNASFYMGVAYLEGYGVRRSLAEAKKLLCRADIDHDHPPARKLLKQITSARSRSET